MIFGTNGTYFDQVAASVPGLNASRIYYGPNAVPTAWPAVPAGAIGVVSIEPNPAALFAGQLDAELTAFAKSAPAGSWLTTNHEANDGKKLPAPAARAMHAYLLDLVTEANPGLKYGAILGSWGVQHDGQAAQWVIPGLDWYALDVYYTAEYPDPTDSLEAFESDMPTVPAYLAVTETNTAIPQQYMRGAWFREVFDWLAEREALAFLSFWRDNDPAKLTGPWDDTDRSAIYSLSAISADAAALA